MRYGRAVKLRAGARPTRRTALIDDSSKNQTSSPRPGRNHISAWLQYYSTTVTFEKDVRVTDRRAREPPRTDRRLRGR